ncbi:hypothetical protein CBS101457_005119 [Exobasidium rhododendri]|nr:hypothetical protein CBS101457_005119 [Exobasidium rhododendri]
MEKTQLLEAGGSLPMPSSRPPHRRRSLPSYLIVLLAISALVHLFSPVSIPRWVMEHARVVESESVKIGTLIPTDCWTEQIKPPFECYYLYAPLDHLNETDTRTAKLAVLKYPAGGGKTPADKVQGTILTNPGGPGGSGISLLLGKGGRFNFTTTAGAMDNLFENRYNILSWDPRAVGYSTPSANCYKNDDQALYNYGAGLSKSSSSAASFTLQYDRLQGRLCAENATLADELRFVSTPSTARDLRLLYKAAGDSLLSFWGFSYGTALGSVFCDMFPDEVGRVVLDGTVDVPNYMAGNWSDNLLDAQDTYERGFLGECSKAGDKCALNKVANGTDLKELLDDFQSALIEEPLISTRSNATLLDYSTLKGAIFSSLYTTYGWPNITKAIAKAIESNATDFLNGYSGYGQAESSPQAFVAIAGGDALVRREHDWDLSHYKNLIAELEKQSEFAGEIWAEDKNLIQSWPIVGKERHFGNFTSHTRNPILFVGNDYDPATPLLYARKMATLFPNASVLRVKAYGHCSTSQVSKCAMKTISNYFVRGTIPERTIDLDGYVGPGKICEVDSEPWDEVHPSSQVESQESSRIIMNSLQETWKQISRRRL